MVFFGLWVVVSGGGRRRGRKRGGEEGERSVLMNWKIKGKKGEEE